MAQNFVGSNNLNLLMPIGQFGSRNMGGKDAASARYIHTTLNPVTRSLFNAADNALLVINVEEGEFIEPNYYIPVVPLILINGAEGIGSGWSTSIPRFNPRDIVKNLKRLMEKEPYIPMTPWYQGFRGTIEEVQGVEGSKSYTMKGVYRVIDEGQDSVEISELPIGKCTRDYKIFLEEMLS